MAIPITNFGLVTVSGGYSSAANAITLQTGDGSKLPDTTGGYRYPLTWWDATTYAHAADDPNVEIVTVTDRSGDVLTVSRGQESTSASNKNTAGKTYRMSLGLTAAIYDSLRVSKNTHQGLVLQTDRDSSDAHKKVELAAVDYLVMNDGTISDNSADQWTGKTADITVSGAGGLDTGSEESGVWYEIHAVEKEDGTRNLLLHKSFGWFVDVSYLSGADAWQNIASATSNAMVAQGVQPADSGKIVFVEATLQKVGAPTGVLQCAIYSNSAGVPGSSLVSSHALDVSKLPGSATTVRFTFPHTAPVLSAATQYHIVLSGSWTVNGTNYVQWRMDGSAGAYAGGAKAIWNGTSWSSDADDDMMFALGIEKMRSALTLPSGYTKQCLLGWVHNDGDGNFLPFLQVGKTRRAARLASINIVEVMDGTVQVVAPDIPPLEMCVVWFGCSGTGTQVGLAAIGDCRSLDVSMNGDTTGAQAILSSGVTSTRPGGFTAVLLQRGFCFAHGVDGAKIWVAGFSW